MSGTRAGVVMPQQSQKMVMSVRTLMNSVLSGAKVLSTVEATRAHKIVRSGTFAMKPMFADEAAEQLELLKQGFYVFSNAETNQINVIYKRSDGSFGLIEPEF